MKLFPRTFYLILLFAFVLRVYVCINTAIINSDGVIYIDQARITYYGLWNTIESHENRIFSLYPILISAMYFLIRNWIIAASIVNLILGTALLIPIYGIARRYFNEDTSILLTLLFSVIPTMTFNSTDVMRDPTCWFFLAWGLYFLLSDPIRQSYLSVFVCGFCFVLAFLTRLETIVFIPITALYIYLSCHKKKLSKAVIFLIPFIAVAIVSIMGMLYAGGADIFQDRFSRITSSFWSSFSQYDQLREYFESSISHPPQGIPPTFFENTRTVIWFIPVSIIFNNALAAFHYPFFILFLVGTVIAAKKRKEIRNLLYFSSSILGMFILLYLYVLAKWEMEHRWIVPLIIYSILFLGLGLEKVIEIIKKWKIINPLYISVLVGMMILLFALPKDITAREQDKRIFRNIGETIRQLEPGEGEIQILATGDSYRWVNFYANLSVKGAPYPDKYREYERFVNQKTYKDFVKTIKDVKFQYLVLEERKWVSRLFEIPFYGTPDLKRIGEWYHPDSGRLVLLKVLYGK